MRTNTLLITLFVVITSCNRDQNTSKKIESLVTTNIVAKSDTVIENTIEEQEVPIQLITKHELTEKDVYVDYDGGNQLADYFLIEIIDKDTFDKNKSMSVNMLSTDTTLIKKQNGILRLPCRKGEITFTDNLSDGENHKEYTYIGEIDYLSAYVLSGIYWEDWNYFMVDKTNGSTVQTFINNPYLSPDGKYIISVDLDTSEGIAYMDLYEVTDRKYVDPIIGMYIKKWIPINSTEPMYWGNDNFLYIPIIHNQDYWACDGNYAGLSQYIRLKPIV